MKTNTKRLLSMIVALVMILSMLPMMASAAETTTIYLKPGDWNQASAWFQAWVWGSSSSGAWYTFADNNADGVFEADVPADTTGLIILRKAPTQASGTWDCWNRVGDIPYDGTNNCISITGWSEDSFSWSDYEPPATIPEWESPVVDGDSVTFSYWSSDSLSSVDVRGTINNWTETAEHHMSKDAETGIWSVTVSGLYNGTYEYKFVTNGADWINDPKNTGAQVGGNNTFTITDGKVDINEPEYSSPVISGTSVTFNYWQAEEFTSASVYGDMSGDGWATAYPLVKNEETGVWSVTVDVPYNGDYEYKIVVDDAWLKDPKNDNVAANGNSLFSITEGAESDPELPVDPVEPQYPEMLHLVPNSNWLSDNAQFAAYFYNTDGEYTWVSMEDSNLDFVYDAAVPQGMTSVIFCRINSAAEEPSWDVKWSQSTDITIPTDGTNLFLMADTAWDKDSIQNPWAGQWFTYPEPPQVSSPVVADSTVTINYWCYKANTVKVYGSMNGWKTAYPMTQQDDGTWSVTIQLPYDGIFEYMIVVDGHFINDPNSPAGLSPDGNSVFATYAPVAEIYGLGEYYSFSGACSATATIDDSYVISLLQDVVADDLYDEHSFNLDLNGHDATLNFKSSSAFIYVQDSATNDPNATEWGKLIVNGAEFESLGGYVMLPEDDGYAFHSYTVEITHISLQPGKDALGYKAAVTGNSAVMNAITGFGFEMGVEGGNTVICEKDGAPTGGVFTLRLQNILACGGGEMNISAYAFVTFNTGESGYTNMETTTMKDTIQTVDANWSNYSTEQQEAVTGLMAQHADLITKWNLSNISIAE